MVVRWIRAWFRKPRLDIYNKDGSVFEGLFRPVKAGIAGRVAHYRKVSALPPKAVIAVRNGEVVGATSDMVGSGKVWDFAIPLTVTPADILRGELQVFAVDYTGARCKLQIDGQTQLRFIKQAGI